MFTSLSQNASASNLSLGQQLINDQHRYLIEKYFDNERTATTTTIGGKNYTLTAPPAANATSATLTAAWTLPTVTQLVTFSDGEQQNTLFTNGSTAISWGVGLTNAVTTAISTIGVQAYRIPANISKIKDVTVNIGQLKYTPMEIHTRQEWDQVNFLPYTSDIPQYFFIYGGFLNLWPIPSSTGNILTYNYKIRVADFSFADYTTGTITSMVIGSTAITASGSTWSAQFPLTTTPDLIGFNNLYLQVSPPQGDGTWYKISNFLTDTTLVLEQPVVQAPSITSASYTIGQLPLLQEDFHDMLVYGALKTYFSSIVKDTDKFQQYNSLYIERLQLLEDYAGTKTAMSVDLGAEPMYNNPNLFIYPSNGSQ